MDTSINNQSQNYLNTSSSYQLNQTTKSICYYSPILNEIFEYKLCIKNKLISLYNLITSIIVCIISIIIISMSEDTFNDYLSLFFNFELTDTSSYYILNVIKTITFIIFVGFFLSIFYSSWSLITASIKKLSLSILDKKLNKRQKTLLGIDLLEEKKDSEHEFNNDTLLLKQQQQQLEATKLSLKTNLPYFSLISPKKSPTKVSTADSLSSPTTSLNVYSILNSPTQQYIHHHHSLTDTGDIESVNFNDKYINKYFSKLEENEQQKHLNSYNYNIDNFIPDDAFERYNYQQKQKKFLDNSLELRNYQYQIGTKPISLTTTASSAVITNTTTTTNAQLTQSPQQSTTIQSPLRHSSIEQLQPKLTHSPSSLIKSSNIKVENYFFLPENENCDLDELINRHTNDELRRALHLTCDNIQIEQIWCKKFSLNRVRLDIERENLRKWISLTILKPIIKEINNINEQLVKIGNNEMKIGQATVAQLNNFIQLNNSALTAKLTRTIQILIPYLELTTRQDYLIQRLNELSMTGCISDYHWNGGGMYKNKDWIDYLPTDASLLMHMFCTYMDSRLLPRYPNLKPFTTQYFYKETNLNNKYFDSNDLSVVKNQPIEMGQQQKDKTQLSNSFSLQQQQQQQQQQLQSSSTGSIQLSTSQIKVESHSNMKLYIHEFKSDPSLYRVVFNKDVFDINQGRNNLFDSILCFLHIVQEQFNGMLGAVSLGQSGVNLLSTIDQ